MSMDFLSLSEVYYHAISQVNGTFQHFLHLGVLHDEVFSLEFRVGDEVYKLARRHAELVPAKPIPGSKH
jgi:hypothetical protein